MTRETAIDEFNMPRFKRKTARQAPWRCKMDTYDFIYTDAECEKLDVVKPGFFNVHRSELLVGTMIECRLGHPEDGTLRGTLEVIECPAGDREGDVMVAVGEFRKFTPVRHDGKVEKAEKEKAT